MSNMWKRMFIGIAAGVVAQFVHDHTGVPVSGLVAFCVVIALAPNWHES